MHSALQLVLIGAGATAFIDAWAWVRRRLFGTKLPDYALVGRWLGSMPGGRFVHESIARAARVPGEARIGWLAHYLIGIAFAALVPIVGGPDWIAAPTPGPALLVGVVTVVAPFLVMQPAMGAGFAASRAPRPATARAQSLVTHLFFGVGLYLAATVLELFNPGE